MVPAALYARVSTADQRDQGTSLDTQRDQGLLKAAALGWEVSPGRIILEDWTGKDLERPGLQRMLGWARSRAIQGIVIYTLDRLYRPENDGDEWRVFEVLQQFQDAGVEVAWVDPSIPSKGPLASIFTFLDAWRAGRERRAIVERTMRGRLEKARRGKVVSGAAACFGYRYEPKTSTLVAEEDEAKIVRLAFHLYTQERLSLINLADRLNRLGILPPRGGARWRASGLARMLRNEAYAGTLWQNRWRRGTGTKQPRRQMADILKPRAEQLPASVPSIVPREVFEAAQRRLAENLR
ncbi:MAG: recombinase family protein [Chloroflexi bacterium]|nr:recombinase family protein [Chloroflexota bacterium]